jgi:hypothetical protein
MAVALTRPLSLSLSAWAISMRREGLVYLVVVAAAALQAEWCTWEGEKGTHQQVGVKIKKKG